MRAAVHTRSIVGDNTTHHSRADAGRIRREDTPEGFQDLVHTCSHDTRLQGDAIGICCNRIVFPILARDNEDAVAHALPRQRSARSTKREGQPILVGRLDNL